MDRLKPLIERALWDVDLSAATLGRRALFRVLRLVYAVGRNLLAGHLSLRAMSLVYTTLLSLAPLLAVSFSVLKSFGVHSQIQPLLVRLLAPLGVENAQAIAMQVIGFVDNLRVGVLGSLGLVVLIYTVVSLVQKVEETFNRVWHATELRSLGERFSEYLSVILVGPVLLFSGTTALGSALEAPLVRALFDVPVLGRLLHGAGELVPLLLLFAGFAFLYRFVPNTAVRLRPALVGAAVGSGLWVLGGIAFGRFIASAAHYDAIYSSFAILVILMIRVYVAWLTLLIGATVSFYVQHPEYLRASDDVPPLSIRLREQIALLALYVIARDYERERPLWTAQRLAQWLEIPGDALDRVLGSLERGGLLVRTASSPPAFVPGASPERISLREALDLVRSADETHVIQRVRLPNPAPVARLLASLERARSEALGELALLDLAKAPSLLLEAAPQQQGAGPPH